MQTSYFDYLVKEKLPIGEISVFGELSELPYVDNKKEISTNQIDLNNLTNDHILRIIKDKDISLNYQFFSISTFTIDRNKLVFFTQKSNGIKSSLSQIFLNNKPVLILETKFLNLLEILLDEFIKQCRSDITELIKDFSVYEYR